MTLIQSSKKMMRSAQERAERLGLGFELVHKTPRQSMLQKVA